MISVELLLAHRMEMNLVTTTTHADMCEYEVEELIRCVPKADATGQITLQDFLAAKETVLSKLTKLRLLQ